VRRYPCFIEPYSIRTVRAAEFSNQTSGRLVVIEGGDQPVHAFVPSSLEPVIAFDSPLINSLSMAERALGELDSEGRHMVNPHLLIRPFMTKEAQLSSLIEGTQATIDEVYEFQAGQLQLAGVAAPEARSEVREVVNYILALQRSLSRVKTLPLSLRLIREAHEDLLRGVRGQEQTPGEFRTTQNLIGAPNSNLRDAIYVPPPINELMPCLDALEKYIHATSELRPLVRIALIHYQFEAIHPFRDGNGRVGRMLISLLLQEYELLSHPLLYLSAYFEANRRTYYDLLLAVTQRGAWEDWVRFFLDGVAVQATAAVSISQKLRDLRNEWREQVSRARASANLLRIIDALFATPYVTVGDVQRLLEVTDAAARYSVHRLVREGILTPVGESRYRRRYRAGAVMRILTEAP
jgi:Fic family protein